MDTVYWISLIVGGFFVLLSMLGGDSDTDTEVDLDGDFDADVDGDVDLDAASSGDADISPDFVDLFSIRALFLSAAFFGLTGVLLSLTDAGEPLTATVAALTGLVVGLCGNYAIKRIGYAHVSSTVSSDDLRGRTGTVLLPFEGSSPGKIALISKGQRLHLIARAFEGAERFEPGEEVVVVRVNGSIVEVVKPE